MLCDTKTHFMCNTLPYLGTGTFRLPRDIKRYREYYLIKFTKPYTRRGRTVTMDNWLSTLQGAMSLHEREREIKFVGTIRAKPYLSKAVFATKLEVGKTKAVFSYDKRLRRTRKCNTSAPPATQTNSWREGET